MKTNTYDISRILRKHKRKSVLKQKEKGLNLKTRIPALRIEILVQIKTIDQIMNSGK